MEGARAAPGAGMTRRKARKQNGASSGASHREVSLTRGFSSLFIFLKIYTSPFNCFTFCTYQQFYLKTTSFTAVRKYTRSFETQGSKSTSLSYRREKGTAPGPELARGRTGDTAQVSELPVSWPGHQQISRGVTRGAEEVGHCGHAVPRWPGLCPDV